MKKPTVGQIRDASPAGTLYFSEGALAFFSQKLSDFSVSKDSKTGAWETRATWYGPHCSGTSVKLWDADTLFPYKGGEE
jgi:hypothetical protein